MIPSILRLIEEINSSQKSSAESLRKMEPEKIPFRELPQTKPKALQFTVENFGFGSLLKDSALALIDTALIAQWNETFGDQKVNKISLENPVMGKSLICSFEAFKESKYEGKGIVQLSEKTRLALNIRKGDQILIKPIIGQPDEAKPALNQSHQQLERSALVRLLNRTCRLKHGTRLILRPSNSS